MSFFSKAWDQVNIFDNGKSWKNQNPGQYSGGGGGGGGGGGWGDSKPKDQPVAANDDWKKQYLDALRPYSPPTPKLAKFDIMANWRNAQSAAERAQNPKYELALNNFLAHNSKQKQFKTNEFGLTKENISLEKAQTLEDNATSRTRTAEDTANAIGKVNLVEGQYQTDEGQDFDKNYRDTAEQIAASGGANTGLGRQQSSDMIRLRNVTSQRQLDEFQGQREAKQLFKTRTFEDLARGDSRANTLAVNKTKGAQMDFDSYLEDLSYDETNFRFDNEAKRLEAVFNDTQNFEKSGAESFLGSLAGQGYSAADVAYNRQVYGR